MLYTNCEIPAKLFYTEVIGKSNLAALGEGTEEELQAAFYSILDELCDIDNNQEMLDHYKRQVKVMIIESTITLIESCCFALMFLTITEEQVNHYSEVLNGIKLIRVKFNKDADRYAECGEKGRIRTSIIGMLNNQINTLNDVQQQKGEKSSYNFYQECARLESILAPKNIDQNTSLYMYVEYKKLAKEKIKLQKNGK